MVVVTIILPLFSEVSTVNNGDIYEVLIKR